MLAELKRDLLTTKYTKVFCEEKKIVLKKMETLEEHENKEES